MGLEAAARKAVGGPTPILISEPVEEAHTRGRLVLPNELPGAVVGRTLEGDLIAGFHRVKSARSPLPQEAIRFRGQGGVPNSMFASEIHSAVTIIKR